MFPVTELPFPAERQIFREVQLQIVAEQDRQQRPHREMQKEDDGKHGTRPAARERYHSVETSEGIIVFQVTRL